MLGNSESPGNYGSRGVYKLRENLELHEVKSCKELKIEFNSIGKWNVFVSYKLNVTLFEFSGDEVIM